MTNINSLVPVLAIAGIGAFVLIPINLVLSGAVNDSDKNAKDRLPLGLIFVAYAGAAITMGIGGESVGRFVMMTIFLAATWPLTLWRVVCAPRKR